MTMIINHHEYTEEEVFEALRKRGYLLKDHTFTDFDETFPNGIESFQIDTVCAVKADELPSIENTWENVALKIWQNFTKPLLI